MVGDMNSVHFHDRLYSQMFIEIIRKLKGNSTGLNPQETKWPSDSCSVEEDSHLSAVQQKGPTSKSPHPLRSSPQRPESRLHIGLLTHEEAQVKVRSLHSRLSFYPLLLF